MTSLSPKIEIIKHFDDLINRFDIDIDQSIEKYKENQILGELKCFPVESRDSRGYNGLTIECFDSSENNKSEEVIEWSESTKLIDYLNQNRQRTIEELRKAQEDSLEDLKSKSISDLNHIKESNNSEEMKSRLFADKFHFQVLLKHHERENQESWIFSLFTIVLDFYLSPLEIHFLE